MSDRPIYIFDGMNAYMRAWAAYPQMSTTTGSQVGGCVGFLKTLQKICREFQPSAVYIAWEGGGSQRRRKLFAEYKQNRRPEKLNRFYEDDIPESESNRQNQLIMLLNMLKSLPVCQIYVSDCEGDDIVAFLCNGPFREKEKVIVSSDKDMYQLLDDKTKIYSLHRKRFITAEDVFEEHRIKTQNFALAKSLCGDPGDNVPGIKGIGFKTAATKFPFLGTDKTILLQEVLDYASSHADESAIYRRVRDEADVLKRNWQLVHLDGSMLSSNQVTRVEHAVDTFVPRVNKMSLLRSLIKEGINDVDVDGIVYAMSCLDSINFSSET